MKRMLAIASEPLLDDYRWKLSSLLCSALDAEILDMNDSSDWDTTEQLIANCINKTVAGSVDFVILVSSSGNGLQIMANKDEHIRAAPIPNEAFVEEAVAVDANMCEVCATTQDPPSACEVVVKFALARERARA